MPTMVTVRATPSRTSVTVPDAGSPAAIPFGVTNASLDVCGLRPEMSLNMDSPDSGSIPSRVVVT